MVAVKGGGAAVKGDDVVTTYEASAVAFFVEALFVSALSLDEYVSYVQ